ncbi:hypothetical protein HYE60_01520 [Aggregatibacter actinomycetemcomitans]|uniref:hypothetical protein n=1 Tax=Aggregatibacter actinomycetemcomitans TaxID=714 RepID=UPI00197B0D80|nr:hypothetical protein [Aggregatibacter actinomycetemcomitans]MBN6073951.1 hypothetical protein [Aggregatibacter actinomycetemcomitans]
MKVESKDNLFFCKMAIQMFVYVSSGATSAGISAGITSLLFQEKNVFVFGMLLLSFTPLFIRIFNLGFFGIFKLHFYFHND